MTVPHLVFVYGTLMKGELHHALLARGETAPIDTSIQHARFLRTAETLPAYDLVQIDYYPAMIPGGTLTIHGELYEIDDETLARLDELEEVPTYYERLWIDLADGTRAQTYVMPRDRVRDSIPIPSGHFRLRTQPPKKSR
ncbi:MAG: gamma-glutamylcyclotransferase family protein [Polyangiales bacterium]